jgi:signal transduction histidine kinase
MLTSLETARDKAQAADRAKTAFLAAMSHEFRTPLNAIIGFAEIISKQVFGQIANERYLEASRNILEAGERLSNTTTDVLTIAQLESGSYPLNRDVFDLCALEPDPKVCCVRHAGVIHGSGINRDGARGCGRRSTAGFIGGKLKGIRAI